VAQPISPELTRAEMAGRRKFTQNFALRERSR